MELVRAQKLIIASEVLLHFMPMLAAHFSKYRGLLLHIITFVHKEFGLTLSWMLTTIRAPRVLSIHVAIAPLILQPFSDFLHFAFLLHMCQELSDIDHTLLPHPSRHLFKIVRVVFQLLLPKFAQIVWQLDRLVVYSFALRIDNASPTLLQLPIVRAISLLGEILIFNIALFHSVMHELVL